MARPRNADGQRTRQAVLDAALDLFAEKGYFGTSLRDVAAAVGVRESALYNYFSSKDALFAALLIEEQDAKIDRIVAVADGPITDGRAVLERLAVSALESFQTPRHEKLFRILMSDGLRLAKVGRINLFERLGHGRAFLHDLLRRLMREGWLREADPHVLGLAFTSPLVMWRHLHAIDPRLPMVQNLRAFARQHVDQFLTGAAAPAGRSAAPRRRAGGRAPARAARPSRSKRPTL